MTGLAAAQVPDQRAGPPPKNTAAGWTQRLPGSLAEIGQRAYAQNMRLDPAQEALTNSRLRAAMPAVLERLRHHRAAVDRVYEARRQAESDAARAAPGVQLTDYPIGFCRHIRDDVWHRALADPGFRALLAPGTIVRKVFILLKGQYFQNAVQVGNLYVDVANDTVWIDKPKLEWMHVSEVDYRNAETWHDFAEVAQRYLKVTLFPNLAFPFAFPVAPFLAIRPGGRITLLFAQDLLFLKDLAEGMPRIQALLADRALMNRRLPSVYAHLLELTFATRPPAGFPLPFAPADVHTIKRDVIAGFIALREKPPAEAVAAVDRYMRTIAHATHFLTRLDLVPVSAERGYLESAESTVRSAV